jgi:hypothetical protein
LGTAGPESLKAFAPRKIARAPSPAIHFGLIAPAFPRAKRSAHVSLRVFSTRKTKLRHPHETRGRFSVPDGHDAVKAPQPFTSKSDSGCQWQRLSFIRRGDAPTKL